MDWKSGFINQTVESDRYYNVQHPAQIKESCRNKVTALEVSNNRNKVYDYVAPTLLRESQPLEWKKYNAEDSRWPAACTSSSQRSSWRWNFAHWRSQWVPRKSTCKNVCGLHLLKTTSFLVIHIAQHRVAAADTSNVVFTGSHFRPNVKQICHIYMWSNTKKNMYRVPKKFSIGAVKKQVLYGFW